MKKEIKVFVIEDDTVVSCLRYHGEKVSIPVCESYVHDNCYNCPLNEERIQAGIGNDSMVVAWDSDPQPGKPRIHSLFENILNVFTGNR